MCLPVTGTNYSTPAVDRLPPSDQACLTSGIEDMTMSADRHARLRALAARRRPRASFRAGPIFTRLSGLGSWLFQSNSKYATLRLPRVRHFNARRRLSGIVITMYRYSPSAL